MQKVTNSPCCVKNLHQCLLTIDDDDFSVGVFDCRIVRRNEDASDELYGQGGFAYTSPCTWKSE